MTELKVAYATNIKALRKEKKLTQEELAKIIGVTKLTILRWENGDRVPKADKAQLLADYFGVSVQYLLGYSDFEDDFDAYIQLSNEKEDNEFAYIKSLILSLISQKSLEKVEHEYSSIKDKVTQVSGYTTLLKALNILRDSNEGKLLLWFATLDKDDKSMLLALAENLSAKRKYE